MFMQALRPIGFRLAPIALPVSSHASDEPDDLSPLEEELFREVYGEHRSVAPGDSQWVEMLDQVLERDPFDLRARSEAERHERKLALHPDRLFEAACALLVYWQASGLPESARGKDAEDTAAMGAEALGHAIPRLLQDDQRLQGLGIPPDPSEQREYEELVGELPVPNGAEREFLIRFNRMPAKRRAFLYPLLFQGQTLAERAQATGMSAEVVQKKFMKHFKPLIQGLREDRGGLA
jgi:hypothetical protein